MDNKPVGSLHALLKEIVDYAGLFPPSSLPMQEAVKNYAKYLKSENSWMLGKFIVPVSRLDEFIAEAAGQASEESPWSLSAIAGEDFRESIGIIERFNEANQGKAKIDTIEAKVSTAQDITRNANLTPKGITAYFEIPQTEIMTDLMIALAMTKTRAKIRTGGTTQEAFPPTDYVVKFMRVCIAANVPFKATAGLHHPLRCQKPLTYEADAASGLMNGFLNLFLSAAFLRENVNNSFVYRIMNDMSGDNFRFEENLARWGDNSIGLKNLAVMRQRNAVSFGSCSFEEPIEDLRALGLL